MQTPEQALATARERISSACRTVGRDPASVRLLAVSKTREAAAIRALAALGQTDFGESYAQEAVEKIQALEGLGLCWHFIGPVQSNKTRELARHFHWVHSLDREKIARRLDGQRPDHLPPLDVCVQVNIDGETGKRGVAPEAAAELAALVAELPRLRLRGLMAIPRADAPDRNRAAFHRLAMTLSQMRHTMPGLDTLSMGMSGDFEVAIEEGATMVRLGTALFGPRG